MLLVLSKRKKQGHAYIADKSGKNGQRRSYAQKDELPNREIKLKESLFVTSA